MEALSPAPGRLVLTRRCETVSRPTCTDPASHRNHCCYQRHLHNNILGQGARGREKREFDEFTQSLRRIARLPFRHFLQLARRSGVYDENQKSMAPSGHRCFKESHIQKGTAAAMHHRIRIPLSFCLVLLLCINCNNNNHNLRRLFVIIFFCRRRNMGV